MTASTDRRRAKPGRLSQPEALARHQVHRAVRADYDPWRRLAACVLLRAIRDEIAGAWEVGSPDPGPWLRTTSWAHEAMGLDGPSMAAMLDDPARLAHVVEVLGGDVVATVGAVAPRQCPSCGEEVHATSRQVYCSVRCAARA